MLFRIYKLARNKACSILNQLGFDVYQRTLSPDEYRHQLGQKLLEEAQEVVDSRNNQEMAEEMSDLLEVLYTLMVEHHISLTTVEELRQKKRQERGSFDQRCYHAAVKAHRYTCAKGLSYYLQRPETYPQITEKDVNLEGYQCFEANLQEKKGLH